MDFSASEFENRVERVQGLMRRSQLDALFLTTEADVRYFTGFRTQFWQSPTRPWFCIVPANGKPMAIVPEIGGPLMATTWVDDIRTWESPHENDDGVSLVANALSSFAAVGLPMGRESHLRMAHNDFLDLQSRLQGTVFKDATPTLDAVRFVKSEAEISLQSQICTIASNAFDQAVMLFQEGQTLQQAFKAFKIELLKQGAEDVPYLVGGAGQNGYTDVISPAGQTPLKSGDVFMLDTGATLNGYFCDFDRNFAIGHINDEVAEAHETLWLATEAGLEAARPGVTCAQIAHAMNSVIGEASGNVGRCGHGLGTQLTETPSLIHWDHTVMKEGATMTLEPSISLSGGGMLVHEENIVIRDGAPQLLSKRAPREMVLI